MSSWIFLMIQLLMMAIDWLNHRKQPLTERQRQHLDHALYLARELENKAVTLGCSAGGVKMDAAPVYGSQAVDKSIDDNDFGWKPPFGTPAIGDIK